MELGNPARHERHGDLYWLGPPESKTLHPVWWWYYVTESCPRGGSRRRALEGFPRPPYIGWRALGYKLVSIYPTRLQHGKLIRAGPSCLVYQAVFMSLGPHVRLGRVHGQVGRSSVGRARLSGTTETLVGGDPWVPMSLKVLHQVWFMLELVEAYICMLVFCLAKTGLTGFGTNREL
jgi:hypothetical protein